MRLPFAASGTDLRTALDCGVIVEHLWRSPRLLEGRRRVCPRPGFKPAHVVVEEGGLARSLASTHAHGAFPRQGEACSGLFQEERSDFGLWSALTEAWKAMLPDMSSH